MTAATPQQLRERAKRIRETAGHADRNADYHREMQQAQALEVEADELEARLAERRKKMVQKVKIAQKQLAMDDDAYRELLQTETGKDSASKLEIWQLENVLQRMKKLGFKIKPPMSAGTLPQADDPMSKKIRALWLSLHECGRVQDPSERALVRWAVGQLKTTNGVEALQWLSNRQKRRLIEQLKKWLQRPTN